MSTPLEQLIGPPAGLRDLCVYTPDKARAGYALNRFFAALSFDQPAAVQDFQRDPAAYMQSWGLDDQLQALIQRRNFNEVLQAGGHPFVLFRAFGAMGWTPHDLVRGGDGGGNQLLGALQRGGYIEKEA
jgi:hypothetical protein